MKRFIILLISIMALLCVAAHADTLTLPSSLTIIEEEAFYGDTSLDTVILPEGITEIRSGAFTGSSVSTINLPTTLTSIADDALPAPGSIEVTAVEGTWAYSWAVEKGYFNEQVWNASPLSDFIIEDRVITKYIGSNKNVVIPKKDEQGKRIYKIGDEAFRGKEIESVEIPTSIVRIGDNAFQYCDYLNNVILPNGLTSIGEYAFGYCSALTSIDIPSSVVAMGSCAFVDCNSLKNVTIPGSIDALPDNLFYSCDALENLSIQYGVTFIGSYAFGECDSLTGIELPNSVTSIGDHAFYSCEALASVRMQDSVRSIGNHAFSECFDLTDADIPDRVNSLGICVFAYTGLESVTLPESLKVIPISTFCGCSSLTSVTIPDGVTAIGASAFYGCDSLTHVTIPDSVTEIDYLAFYCKKLNNVTMPGNVSIGNTCFYPDMPENVSFTSDIDELAIEAMSYAVRNVTLLEGVTFERSFTFKHFYSLESVTVSNGITKIGNNAFTGCGTLKKVTMADSVTEIGESAFENSGLVDLTLSNGLTTIGASAFSSCAGLEELTVPDGVTKIGDYVFSGCTGLERISLPDSVTEIGDYAFSGCTALTEVSLPDSVVGIGICAFAHCGSLECAGLSHGMTAINDRAFYNCTALRAVDLPDGVTVIGEYAFANCEALETVSMPNALASISDFAFYECRQLIGLTIPDGVTAIGVSAFEGCSGLTQITIPGSVTSMGEWAFSSCEKLTSVTMPGGFDGNTMLWTVFDETDLKEVVLTSDVDHSAGYMCNSGKGNAISVTIANGVTRIGDNAFNQCHMLKRIKIPNSVTYIGDSSFWDCDHLESIDIPASVTAIGDDAFNRCSSLSSAMIHGGNVEMGTNVFYQCSSLSNVRIPGDIHGEEGIFLNCADAMKVTVTTDAEDGFYALFKGCRSEINVVILDGVTSIGKEAFSNCSQITSVDIPDSVTNIGESAFEGCVGLKSVVLPIGLTSIDKHTFNTCSGLEEVKIPSSITNIGACAFYECTSLSNIIIPDSVNSIGNSAFSGCTGLTEIIIPDSVSALGEGAFADCEGLTEVTISGGLTTLDYDTFRSCTSLTEVTIPASVKKIKYAAFYNCEGLVSITIPRSVTSIQRDALLCCNSVTAFVDADSYAEQYCIENNIPYSTIREPSVAVSAERNNVKPGEEIKLNAYAIGGARPYQYCFTLAINDGEAQVSDWIDEDICAFIASEEGTYEAAVLVRDASGQKTQSKIITGSINTLGADIPQGAVSNNGHYYSAFKMASIDSWGWAQVYCRLRGGYLAAISSTEENDFIYNNVFIPSEYDSAYIGLSDRAIEGVWKWENGEAFSYSHWGSGQPASSAKGYDYARFTKDDANAGWSDGIGTTQSGGIAFICEWGPYNASTEADELDSFIRNTSSTIYNPDLSYLLCQFADEVYGGSTIQMYREHGFEKVTRYSFESGIFDLMNDGIGFTLGIKEMSNGQKMVLVTIRGTSNTAEWVSDAKMDRLSNGWHRGFAGAAQNVYNELDSFIRDADFEGGISTSGIQYVITGHSRGAAVGNLLAVMLHDSGVSSSRIYDYNFACPDTAKLLTGRDWESGCEYIFNICNAADIVSVVPGVIGDGLGVRYNWTVFEFAVDLFTSWGKYGKTYFFCSNWNDSSAYDMSNPFVSHDCSAYLTALVKKPSTSSFKSWAQVKTSRIEAGLSDALDAAGVILTQFAEFCSAA